MKRDEKEKGEGKGMGEWIDEKIRENNSPIRKRRRTGNGRAEGKSSVEIVAQEVGRRGLGDGIAQLWEDVDRHELWEINHPDKVNEPEGLVGWERTVIGVVAEEVEEKNALTLQSRRRKLLEPGPAERNLRRRYKEAE